MLCSAFLFLCLQGWLVQSVFSQCVTPYPAPLAPLTCNRALDVLSAPFVASVTGPLPESFLVPATVDVLGAYGGGGIGGTAVAGELPAGGTTELAGQVPILGGVEFGGIVAAAGTVSIAGTCAGCSTFI